MLNGRKKVEDLKEKRITVQVSAREKRLIQSLAEREGLGVADYIRRVCLYIPYNKIFEGEEV